jgi:hypothetical protein
LTATQGAAIYSNDADQVNITNCIFENNAGQLGGAIFLEKTNLSLLSNNTFINNRAVRYNDLEEFNPVKD